MSATYNEIEPFAVRWLRNLISAGHVAPGVVDDRSITELAPTDVRGPGQRHFFAGIAGWSLALRLAGVRDDADVWTGSCPCQSLSDAGKRLGFADPRHLWPTWFALIRECRPPIVFGEQVASKLGLEWLDLVFADLEGTGYACAAADLCAAGVGAPHIRQRLFFVAYADNARLEIQREQSARTELEAAERSCTADFSLADTDGKRQLDDLGCVRTRQLDHDRNRALDWNRADWISCSDGVSRPVEPGTHPLVAGLQPCMERMRSIEDSGWKEVVSYAAKHQADPDQVLRMVRNSVRTQQGRQIATTGMREQLYASEILLSFLLCLEAAHTGSADCGSFEKARTEAQRRIMRGLRREHGIGRPSCERRSDGQFTGESADALHELPLVLARHAEAHRTAAFDANASLDRVGKLRGYGNAIVPQVAAAFIRAALEAA